MTDGGRGDWSPLVRLSTPAVPPSPPSSLGTTGRLTQTSVTLQWGAFTLSVVLISSIMGGAQPCLLTHLICIEKLGGPGVKASWSL